jgi:hypothetical protein
MDEAAKRDQKLAGRLEASREDERAWSEVPAAIEVRKAPTQVVSFRLSVDELEGLTTAAKATGETVSEYVRGALELRALRGRALPYVDVGYYSGVMTVRVSPASTGRSGVALIEQREDLPFTGTWPRVAPLFTSVVGEEESRRGESAAAG